VLELLGFTPQESFRFLASVTYLYQIESLDNQVLFPDELVVARVHTRLEEHFLILVLQVVPVLELFGFFLTRGLVPQGMPRFLASEEYLLSDHTLLPLTHSLDRRHKTVSEQYFMSDEHDFFAGEVELGLVVFVC